MALFWGLRGQSLQTLVTAVCGLCFLCFGYAQGVMGGLVTVAAFLQEFPQLDTINNASAYNAKVQGAVVGTWNLGCFVSAILTIFLGDYLGRKRTILLGLSIWVMGEIIQSSSYRFGQLIAGRAIAGFGNGFITATVPAYQAECVKSHRKGTILMVSTGAFIALGLALSYWLVFAFSYVPNSSAAWRVPIAFQIIFAVIGFTVLLSLPESPRYLILTGQETQALEVLAALNDEDAQGPEVRDEFLQIKDAILVMAKGSKDGLLSNKERRNFHRTTLACFVQVFQQISGINLISQYLAVMMLTQFSYTGWLARLLGACAASWYFLTSFVAVIGIDRFWGRRWLMLFGASGMCVCMCLLAVLGYLWTEHALENTNIAQTVFLFGFLSFFAVGWQGMAWLYQVEVVPLRIRGPANALSTSVNWLFNFVIVFIAPIAFHNIGWRTYIIFASTNFTIIPLVYFFYPETAYRSLEEVDVLFHLANEKPGNAWLSVVKISKQEPLWFGKNGEVPFDYERSDWHRRYMGSSGSTLNGSGSKEKGSNGGTAGRNTTPSGWEDLGHTVLSSNNPRSDQARNLPNSRTENYRPSTHNRHRNNSVTTGTTAVSTYSRPKTQGDLINEGTDSLTSLNSSHSAHSDPNWTDSKLAPPPLRLPSHTSTRRSSSLSYSSRVGNNDFFVSHPDEQDMVTGSPVASSGIGESVRHLSDDVGQAVREVLARNGVLFGEEDRIIIGPNERLEVRSRTGSNADSQGRVARGAGKGF